jgi:hypothetical protein
MAETTEGRLMMDGLTVGSPPSGNSATSYVIDAGLHRGDVHAVVAGESETGGLVINIVPQRRQHMHDRSSGAARAHDGRRTTSHRSWRSRVFRRRRR